MECYGLDMMCTIYDDNVMDMMECCGLDMMLDGEVGWLLMNWIY